MLAPSFIALGILYWLGELSGRAALLAMGGIALATAILVQRYLGSLARFARFVSELSGEQEPATPRLPFAPATEELASVTIDGEIWIIVDIAMRMLTPRELARCQGFPDSYVLTGTKSEQIARIGNSFPPQLAEAAVRANLPTDEPTQLAAK